MTIKKGEKSYMIIDRKSEWSVTCKTDALTIEYKVSKTICSDESALRKYIDENDLF